MWPWPLTFIQGFSFENFRRAMNHSPDYVQGEWILFQELISNLYLADKNSWEKSEKTEILNLYMYVLLYFQGHVFFST